MRKRGLCKEILRVHDETPSSHDENLMERQDNQHRIEVLKRAGLPSVEDMLIQTNQRLPRQLLYYSCARANAVEEGQGSDLKAL